MIESQVRKFHILLEKKIRQGGYKESDVEKTLSWEEGTIRQLLTGEEELMVEQMLMILDVIGVEPKVFFAELSDQVGGLSADFAKFKTLVGNVVNLLVKNGVITAADLAIAVAAQSRDGRGHP